MRLNIVSPFYYPHIGGMEFALRRIAKALQGMGCDCRVHTSSLTPRYPADQDGDDQDGDDQEVLRVDGGLTAWAAAVPAFARTCDPSADVLLFASLGPGTADRQLAAAREFRRRGGVTVWRSPTADHAIRNVADCADLLHEAFDRVVANSAASAAMTRQALPGVDVRVIENLLLDSELDRGARLGEEPRSVDVAWAGRIEPRKRPLELRAALNALVASGRTVAAQAAPSYGRQALFDEFVAGLDPRVRRVPPSIRLGDVVEHARVQLHLTLREGSPNAVLEALSRGQAVLVSDIPECAELVAGFPGAVMLPGSEVPAAALEQAVAAGSDVAQRRARIALVRRRHGEKHLAQRWSGLFADARTARA